MFASGCVDDNGELQTGDAPAESCVVRSVAATSITSILKEKEECHGTSSTNLCIFLKECQSV